MAEVIGVRFKEVGKIYYFDPKNTKLETGDKVIVETARGIECGVVALPNKDVPDEEIIHPLKPLIRKANKNDISHTSLLLHTQSLQHCNIPDITVHESLYRDYPK